MEAVRLTDEARRGDLTASLPTTTYRYAMTASVEPTDTRVTVADLMGNTNIAHIPAYRSGDGWQVWQGSAIDHATGEPIDHVVPGRKINPGKPRTDHFAICQYAGCEKVGKESKLGAQDWQCPTHGALYSVGVRVPASIDDNRPAIAYRTVTTIEIADDGTKTTRRTVVERAVSGKRITIGEHKGKAGNPLRPEPTDKVTASGKWNTATRRPAPDGGKILVYGWSVLARNHGPWTIRNQRAMPMNELPTPIGIAGTSWDGRFAYLFAGSTQETSKSDRRDRSILLTTDHFVSSCESVMRDRVTYWSHNLAPMWSAMSSHVSTIEPIGTCDWSIESDGTYKPEPWNYRPTPLVDMTKIRKGGYLLRVLNQSGTIVKKRPTNAVIASLIARDANVRVVLVRQLAAAKADRKVAQARKAQTENARNAPRKPRKSASERAAAKLAMVPIP